MRVVILLKFFVLLFSQIHAGLIAAVEAGNYDVRLPFLFYPNPNVNALNEEGIAFLAGLPPKLDGQVNTRRHRNPTRRRNVLRG
jgi:hypothetical protein